MTDEAITILEEVKDRLRRLQRRLEVNDFQPNQEIVRICWAELEDLLRQPKQCKILPGAVPIGGVNHLSTTHADEVKLMDPSVWRTPTRGIPAGVHWTGEEGDEIQRLDVPDEGEPIFDGDYGAALVASMLCDMPFLVYVETDLEPWSIVPFRTPTKAIEWANEYMAEWLVHPESSDIKILVFDTRNQELIKNTDDTGFIGVRRKPQVNDQVEGESRTDPFDGNTFVKTGEEHRGDRGIYISICDIFGGHARAVAIAEWESWEPIERPAT